MNKIRRKWFYYGLVFVAWAAYILLTVARPRDDSQQELDLNPLLIILLTVTLLGPYLLTWLVATIGWYHFSQFAQSAQKKRLQGGVAFRSISRGLGLLIFDLVAIPFFSAARNAWEDDQQLVTTLTIISNYTHIIITLLAFGFLFHGSRVLARSSNYAVGVRSHMLPAFLATALFSLLFSLAVFNNPSRRVSEESGVFATYYLSDPLILTTIIIPLAVTWFLGLQAALNTERYVHALSRPEWKQAIIRYFHGLLAIVSSAIILQGVTMVGSQQLQKINLAVTLAIVYLFIFLQAIGYLFVRSSAKQLRGLLETGAHK